MRRRDERGVTYVDCSGAGLGGEGWIRTSEWRLCGPPPLDHSGTSPCRVHATRDRRGHRAAVCPPFVMEASADAPQPRGWPVSCPWSPDHHGRIHRPERPGIGRLCRVVASQLETTVIVDPGHALHKPPRRLAGVGHGDQVGRPRRSGPVGVRVDEQQVPGLEVRTHALAGHGTPEGPAPRHPGQLRAERDTECGKSDPEPHAGPEAGAGRSAAGRSVVILPRSRRRWAPPPRAGRALHRNGSRRRGQACGLPPLVSQKMSANSFTSAWSWAAAAASTLCLHAPACFRIRQVRSWSFGYFSRCSGLK